MKRREESSDEVVHLQVLDAIIEKRKEYEERKKASNRLAHQLKTDYLILRNYELVIIRLMERGCQNVKK